jgi:indolepyruvate ferredoxin oxidoreductase beta subunit
MVAYLKKQISPERLFLVDGEQALRDLGSPRVLNVVLLGAAVRSGALGLDEEDLLAAIRRRLPQKLHAVNEKALAFAAP